MAGGNLAAAWELTVLFILRPFLAVAFVISFIVLSWYVAWRTVLVHVPLVQEITGLRRKKPVKPKPLNRGRIARFYESQAQRDKELLGTYEQQIIVLPKKGTVNQKGPLKE